MISVKTMRTVATPVWVDEQALISAFREQEALLKGCIRSRSDVGDGESGTILAIGN